MRTADLERLPDARHAEGFARVERGVEVCLLNGAKSFDMLLRWIAGLLPCEIETYHAVMPKIHREFRRFQRVGPVPHCANDKPHFTPYFDSPRRNPSRYRADDASSVSPRSDESREQSDLRVNHAIFVHVLDELESDALPARRASA
jgi:hypothetical protein